MKNKKLFITALLIFIFDRISKQLILSQNIVYYPLVKKYLSLTALTNTGAAFSLFQNHQIVLIVISVVAIIFFFTHFWKEKTCTCMQFAWGFLLGGALGNLYDRAFYKCVVDFINIECLRFPVFNLADIAITLGAIVIFYCSFVFEGKKDARDD